MYGDIRNRIQKPQDDIHMQLVFYVNASESIAYAPCELKSLATGEIACASDIVNELEASPSILVLSGCMNGRVCKVELSKGDVFLFKDVLQEHFPVWARVLFPEHMCV